MLKPRNAFFMTGLYRASARYIDHVFLSVDSDLNVTIPESKKQALHNICNTLQEIRTLEGRIVAQADNLADTLDIAQDLLNKKTEDSDWSPDTDGLFIGHLS